MINTKKPKNAGNNSAAPKTLSEKFASHANALLISILVLALALRLPFLSGSFWLDEAAQALESVRPFSQQLDIAADFQPPLLHYIVHFATYVSHSEWWLRLWGALLPGLLTIWGLWKISRHFFADFRIAALSTILLSSSSLHIFFSQELRPYALPAAIAIWSWWFLLTQTKRHSFVLGFSILTALGLYSSYLYPFVVIGQAGYWLWQTKLGWQKLFAAGGLTLLMYAPWIPGFLEQLSVGTQLRTQLPGWEYVVSTPQITALPMVGAKFLFGNVPTDPLGWQGVFASVVVASIALIWWKLKSKEDTQKATSLFLWWVIIPIMVAWLVSFAVPVIQPKRVLFALPMVYLFCSFLIVSGLRSSQTLLKKLSALTLGMLLFANVLGTFQYYANPQLQREDWRSLAAQIQSEYPSDAVVLMSFPAPFAPWEWYNQNEFDTRATARIYISEKSQIEPLIQELYSDYQYVLVFDYLLDLTDPQRLINQTLLEYGYQESELIDAGPIGFVRVYAQPMARLSAGFSAEQK